MKKKLPRNMLEATAHAIIFLDDDLDTIVHDYRVDADKLRKMVVWAQEEDWAGSAIEAVADYLDGQIK